jgi:hypothetical protein
MHLKTEVQKIVYTNEVQLLGRCAAAVRLEK